MTASPGYTEPAVRWPTKRRMILSPIPGAIMFSGQRKLALNGPRGTAACAVLLASLLDVPCLRAGTDEPGSAVHVRVHPAHERQTIDGFGGSLAYWGYDADDTALRYAFEDLGATFVRVPGDVASAKDADQYRAALRRVARLAPKAKVLVSFWQPRTAAKPDPADWLDTHPAGGLTLRPALYGAWADAVVARIKVMRDE
jgi:O-glycosyl hydrolase